MLKYHAAYYEIEDGWYMAKVLDFPGAVSQGQTLNSARRMIRDALRSMVEWYLEDGQPLPRPKRPARDKKAVFMERIGVQVRLQTEAAS
jgi:predicted RNase H-like HicB family nuclease